MITKHFLRVCTLLFLNNLQQNNVTLHCAMCLQFKQIRGHGHCLNDIIQNHHLHQILILIEDQCAGLFKKNILLQKRGFQ